MKGKEAAAKILRTFCVVYIDTILTPSLQTDAVGALHPVAHMALLKFRPSR